MPALVAERDTKEKIDAYWSNLHGLSWPKYDAAMRQGKDHEMALLDSTIWVNGQPMDLGFIQSQWNTELAYLTKGQSAANKAAGGKATGGWSGGGGGGGGGGGSKNVPQKKPEPPPPPTAKLVSFGKLFCSFCLPCLTGIAEQQDIDEVQINFYQLNDSCGPISLHSVAEFPIEIDYAEAKFAARASAGYGESMTVFEFISWCNNDFFNDKRAPGYGMRDIIEPETTDAQKEKQKDTAADAAKDNKQMDWLNKYGKLRLPILTMKIDIVYEGDNNKIDLLYKLQNRVGAQYNAPPAKFDQNGKQTKRIMRVDLFDRTYSPYSRTAKVLQDENGMYRAFESDVSGDEVNEFVKKYAEAHDRDYAQPPDAPRAKVETSSQSNRTTYRLDNGKNVTVGPPFVSGKNVMKEYLGEIIPKIDVGINSTMVINATFNSAVSGLMGTVMMKSNFAKSTMAPSGLSSAENNLPVKTQGGELTLNTVGCPLADIMQTFFIDFGTGTTLDNQYKVKGVQHNFANGKFETSWSMQYFDAYSTFFGAASVANALKDMHKDTKEKKEQDDAAAAASGEPQADPPPNVTSSQMNTSTGADENK